MTKTAIVKLVLLSVAFGVTFYLAPDTFAYGGEMIKNESPAVTMSYRIEGAYMPYTYIQLDIMGSGQARLSYEFYPDFALQGKSTVGTITFTIDDERLKQLAELHNKTDFFHVVLTDLNKDRMRVTDAGTTTLVYSGGGKERKMSYGYVQNNPLQELVSAYYQIVQEHLPKINR